MTRAVLIAALLVCAFPTAANALPVYAHEYGFSCGQCHTVVPHLNAFGQDFLLAGFRLPRSLPSRSAFPIAVKANFAYSSADDPTGLPKAIVDEVELLAGAPVTGHVSYRLEQYVVDGGVPGSTRDAWLQFTSDPNFGSSAAALRVTGGQFTLPLPVDPETQRDTLNHYAVFDQKVGDNPFDFFDDRIGLDAEYGRSKSGLDVNALVLRGHDPQSGLPNLGYDRMFTAEETAGGATLWAYRYDGTRPLSTRDAFWRQGFSLIRRDGKEEVDVLVQTGNDSSVAPFSSQAMSSGGFAQLRWAFDPGLVGIVRYDRVSDALSGAQSSVTGTLLFRPHRDMRFTVEDVFSGGHQTLNAAWLVAY